MGRGYVRHRPERSVPEATEAQIRAMNEKLESRANHIFKAQQAAQSPKEKAALEWEKPVGSIRKTLCRRYTCIRRTEGELRRYALWKTDLASGSMSCLTDRLDNFLQVETMAQQDWEKSA